ncbi:DUF411 domain-containing protein [Paenalcaligenes sp. Me131]|uniref:DUF411 domain-containing protein n=1 Tax=Paenalcaligenes sp. Me131 TaxID=3392636 RepID=UPI003D2A5095
MTRLASCVLALAALVPVGSALAAPATLQAVLHKDPWCGCCNAYADYLEQHGMAVTRVDHADMVPVKQQLGTDQAPSCHTVELDGYVIEGHVPVAAIQKLLAERPKAVGISVPGMPQNSPGMGPEIPGTLPVYLLDESGNVVAEYGRF